MAKNKTWFRMEKKSPELAEVEIFGEIDDFWGVGPSAFKAALDKVKDAKSIKLLLNSPGGSVFDGLAIHSMLAAYRDKLDIEVIGVAASIASIIALAGRKLTMAAGSFYMIHNPLTIMMGDAADLRKTADILDKMKGNFVEIYKTKSGKTDKDISDMMDSETWLTDKEAVEAGFADATEDHGKIAARLGGCKIVGRFTNVPEALIVEGEGIKTARQLEEALRDAGMTRTEAEAIVADGWKGMADQGDPEPVKQGDPVKAPIITPAMRIADINSRIRTPTP
jgi:ATP-dependent Clp protease protease subunit